MFDMLARIKSRIASFRVGFLTICLNVKCLSRDDTGHLLKSPSKKIPAFGYLLRARSRVAHRCSMGALLSLDGGLYTTQVIRQEKPR